MGKSGVVQELDGRGGARVMLGLLSARIDVGDLVSAADGGRDKPTLSSLSPKAPLTCPAAACPRPERIVLCSCVRRS